MKYHTHTQVARRLNVVSSAVVVWRREECFYVEVSAIFDVFIHVIGTD